MTTAITTNDASYRCPTHSEMLADLELVRDVERGTSELRKKGTKYLPKLPGETSKKWLIRLGEAVLFNSYRTIRDGAVGMVCKTNPVYGTDIPPENRKHFENIDLAGTHLDVFAKEFLVKAFEGQAHIFVDMAAPLPKGSTRAQAQVAKCRPWWTMYTKDQAINFIPGILNGEEILTLITFLEPAAIRDGRYGMKSVPQYRTLWLPVSGEDQYGNPIAYGPMQWELQREVTTNRGKTTLEVIGNGETTMPRIPVSTLYTCKRGFMYSDPRLLDLAHMNLAHLREYSYLKTQQRSQMPILVHKKVRGSGDGKAPKKEAEQPLEINLGLALAYRLTGKDDSLKWEVPPGEGITVCRQNLIDLEDRMSAYGMQLVASNKGTTEVTATEKLIDHSEHTSSIATIARGLQDVLEECAGFHAQLMGNADAEGHGGTIKITVDATNTEALKSVRAPQDDKMPGVGLPVADAARTAAANTGAVM